MFHLEINTFEAVENCNILKACFRNAHRQYHYRTFFSIGIYKEDGVAHMPLFLCHYNVAPIFLDTSSTTENNQTH